MEVEGGRCREVCLQAIRREGPVQRGSSRAWVPGVRRVTEDREVRTLFGVLAAWSRMPTLPAARTRSFTRGGWSGVFVCRGRIIEVRVPDLLGRGEYGNTSARTLVTCLHGRVRCQGYITLDCIIHRGPSVSRTNQGCKWTAKALLLTSPCAITTTSVFFQLGEIWLVLKPLSSHLTKRLLPLSIAPVLNH
jgi:hypothetical protein